MQFPLWKNLFLQSSIPILSGIKFYISDGRLNLASTDIDMGINYQWMKSTVISTYSRRAMVVNAKVLSEIVRKLPSGCIDFLLEGNRLTVNAELKMVLSCNDADDFLKFQTRCITLSKIFPKVFKDMISRQYTQSDDYTLRPQLTGILVECVDGFKHGMSGWLQNSVALGE